MNKTVKVETLTAKKAIIVALLCAAVIIASAIVSVFTISLSIKTKMSSCIFSAEDAMVLENIDHIIVLGAGLRKDGRPSDMLADRLKTGAALLEAHPNAKLILTGDNSGDHYNEVAAMKKFVLDLGIDEARIIEDGLGFSTYESIYRAAKDIGAKNTIIVTQEYHLFRALYIAKQSDMNAVGVSADLRGYSGQSLRNAREHLARVKDFFLTLVATAER